jgi:hypothetical protein
MTSASSGSKSTGPMLPIVGVVMLALGAAGGYVVAEKKQAKEYTRGYDAGFAAARAKVEGAGLFSGSTEQLLVSGTVKSVGPDYVEFETPASRVNPFEEVGPTMRRARVTADTVIVQLTEKTPAELQAENEAFIAAQEKWRAANSAGGTATPPPNPPSPFVEKKSGLGDVKAGMAVTATSATDIAKAGSFDALRIEIRMQTAEFVPPAGGSTLPPGAGDAPELPPRTNTPPEEAPRP